MRIITFFFCFSLLAARSGMAQNRFNLNGKILDLEAYQPLHQAFSHFKVFQLESGVLADFMQDGASAEKTIDLSLPEVGEWTLLLYPRNLLGDHYRLLSDASSGHATTTSSGNLTWQGSIAGLAGSKVSLTISPGYIFGSIRTATESWFIEPVSNLIDSAAPDHYILYQTSDVLPGPGLVCGVTEVSKQKKHFQNQHPEDETGPCFHIEVAIASVFDMKQRYGSVGAVEIHNIGVMNEVASDYDDAFANSFYFLIAAQYVSTSLNSSLDSALTSTTSADGLLNKFSTWGESGYFGVPFDLGLLWTTRDICVAVTNCSVIGYSSVQGLCTGDRYTVLEDYDGINPGGTGWRLRVLTSHEIGHQLSCNHVPSQTIMYPAAQNTTTWDPQSIAEVNAFIGSMYCLSPCGANFSRSDETISEGGAYNQFLPEGGPGCGMGYIDKLIPVHYSGNAANDTLAVMVVGGTAVEGKDYQLVDSVLVFPSGLAVAQDQDVRIRVWNDAIAEPDKTILLAMDGAKVGPQNITTVQLRDDDQDPRERFYQYVQSGQFFLSPMSAPFYGASQDAKTQYIVSAAELLAMGLKPNDEIFALELNVSSKNSTQPFKDFTIGMKHTTQGINFENDYELGGFTTVFSADYSTQSSWNHFDFSTPFFWNGVSNIAFQICFDNQSVSANDKVYSFSSGETHNTKADVGSGCNLGPYPIASVYGRPLMRLFKGNNIAIDLHDAADTELKAGQTAYFKDAQNEFVLALKQVSTTAVDAGCVHVEIDRAGTGRQTVPWLPNGSYISDKTFAVTMDEPHTAFELTLYFSAAEMAIWGNESMNILKSTQPISVSTGQQCSINENLERSIFGPAYDEQAYYAFKGLFKPGVGFALTNAKGIATRNESFDPSLNPAPEIGLYPNPASSEVNLHAPTDETYLMSLFDLSGKLVLTEKINRSNRVSLEQLPGGLYFAVVTARSGAVYRSKLIRQ